ncbi:MAG: hypothetical protein ACJ8C4_13095 [Gemmataceae bacterium]
MTPSVRSQITRQVNKVRRRLIALRLLQGSIVAIAIALAVTTVWLLVEPFAFDNRIMWLRWAVLGGTAAVGFLGACVIALMRAPDRTRAALWLDDAFALRERTVTSLSLTSEDEATPAGQALLQDALARVNGLKVGERFPLHVGRVGWLVPGAVAVLALVALFYDPVIPKAGATTEDPKLAAADKAALEKKLAEIQKPKRDPLVTPPKEKSEQLKQLEARLDELERKPRDTTQQLRDRVKEITPIEDEIKKLERERTEKARMLQQQLQNKDGLMPNDAPKDGPANSFQKALSEGDLEQAREELDKLAKKMQAGEMSDKDKENLAKQMNNIQKKLQDLSQQKDKQEMLKKLADEGKLDPEALEREMQQLKQDNEKLKDLQKLANKMSQCQQCMKSGDMSGAQKAMGEALDQLDQMNQESNELNELREQLSKLSQSKDALTSACDSNCPGGDGDDDSDGKRNNPSELKQGNGRGLSRAEGGRGTRPEDSQGKVRSFDAKQQGQFNAKGQKMFDGFVPGQAFKKKSGVELAGEIKQAAQQAPEAIENQRIPKAARDMAKGYFKNLGGQAEAAKPDDKAKADAEKPKADEKK